MKRSTQQYVKAGTVTAMGIPFAVSAPWLFAAHLAVAALMASTGTRAARRERHAQPRQVRKEE